MMFYVKYRPLQQKSEPKLGPGSPPPYLGLLVSHQKGTPRTEITALLSS